MPARTLKTIELCFEIIDLLKEEEGQTLGRIAGELGKPPGTVHGYLRTLEACGYIVQEGDLYRLSLKFAEVGISVLHSKRAYMLAEEYTTKAAEETDCRSIFAVEENGRGVYTAREAGDYSTWKHEQIGRRFYLHATAAGKAILANLVQDQIDAILDPWGLPKKTENTITDRDELMEELEQVREIGVGFNREEHIEGIHAVSAPVFGPSGAVIGALSANGPANQLDGERLSEELPAILIGIANEFELDLIHAES